MKMAYVELDEDKKHRFPTQVSDLPHDVVEDICLSLNPRLLGKDYRSLAGKMGFTHKQVKNIDCRQNQTEEVLAIWVSGPGSKTVTDLIDLLKSIQRFDVIKLLKQHEYSVIPNRSTSVDVICESDLKEPIEHDVSSEDDHQSRVTSNMVFNGYYTPVDYPISQVSDPSTASTLRAEEELDTDEETNLSVVSGSFSNRTSSSIEWYLEGSNISRTSTNDHLEYGKYSRQNNATPSGNMMTQPSNRQHNLSHLNDEFDDILEQKLQNQRAAEDYHPSYQFRTREGSNASTSTAGSSNASTRIHTGIQTENVLSPTAADVAPIISQPLLATDKIALLIGNMSYGNLSEGLSFPHKDVYDLEIELTKLGFKVLALVDLTLREMRTIMLAYCQLLGRGVFAVFYYAGHGFEENGKNYLMPVDATSHKNDDEFIQAQEILTEMRLAQTALNLVIIDTCRVKGINVKTTAAPLQRTGTGNTIIAYSCSSSMPAFETKTQQNGVYMTELLPRIQQDKRIEHILMEVNEAVNGNPLVVQRPVYESDAIGDCRLTCKIDATAHYHHWQSRLEKWVQATTPPPNQVIERIEEKVEIKLTYVAVFSNMLQINVSVNNLNDSRFVMEDVRLRSTSEVKIDEKRYLPDGFIPPKSGYYEVISFRITDIQKITNMLLLVLEMRASINGELNNLEVKLNADLPLISSFLQEFLSWITSDKRHCTGHLKNTWV